ncbi:MAG: hypothetical protein H6502_02800 [Candidatus Woesearchaeota archaeon]|nr:MAG: hypothetical protein H6502_02800 [Candidatus Woesearchaeota archaeon]
MTPRGIAIKSILLVIAALLLMYTSMVIGDKLADLKEPPKATCEGYGGTCTAGSDCQILGSQYEISDARCIIKSQVCCVKNQ